jgi:KAP family P-loop domain
VERHFVPGSVVISLQAPFGSGKTWFLNFWQKNLAKRRAADPSLPSPIILNAWESDFCGEPLVAVISELVKQIESGQGEAGKTKSKKLKGFVNKLCRFSVSVGSQLLNNVSGVDFKQAVADAAPDAPDFVATYNQRQEALSEFKKLLKETLGGDDLKMIVMVDELDRCRPDYAINYLETIKHIFDIPGLAFVLAVDYDQMASSAKCLFGADLNFAEYFRKFVGRQAALPYPTANDLESLINNWVTNYLQNSSLRKTGYDPSCNDNLKRIVKGFRPNLRQLNESLRISAHVLSLGPTAQGVFNSFTSVLTLLLVFSRTIDGGLHKRICQVRETPELLAEAFAARLGVDYGGWFFAICFASGSKPESAEMRNQQSENALRLFKKFGFSEADMQILNCTARDGLGVGLISEIIEKINAIESIAGGS